MAKKQMTFVMCMLTACLTAALCFAGFLLIAALLPQQPSEPAMLVTTPAPAVPSASPVPLPSPSPAPTATPTLTPVPDSTVHIRVVGDIMCHDRQLRATVQEDGSYVMDDWFEVIRPSLEMADLAIGNLETTFSGAEKGYSGFPRFNTPDVLADVLKDAGFDVLTMANNHSNDFRAHGIARTLSVLDERGLAHTGAYSSAEQYDQMLILDVKGIRVGILAYHAGYEKKSEEDFSIRPLSKELVQKDVAQMHAEGADFILAMVHWGEEYEETPGSTQKAQARMLAAQGVDAVFGSHPHVIQTAEFVTAEDENGQEHTAFVAYSMGNFMSNQQNRPCDMGIIFDIEVKKQGETGRTELTAAGYVPTVVYRGYANHRDTYSVLPCGIYKEKSDHPKRHRCETVWDHITGLMGEELTAMEN